MRQWAFCFDRRHGGRFWFRVAVAAVAETGAALVRHYLLCACNYGHRDAPVRVSIWILIRIPER